MPRQNAQPLPDSYWNPTAQIYEENEGSNGNKNINIAAAGVAVPVDIQFSAVKVTPVTLASGIAVRNLNAANWTGGSTPTDWSAWKGQVWRVDNTHDQAIDIVLNYVNVGDFTKLDGTVMKITVPANKSNVLVTPNDFPILGQVIADPCTLALKCSAGTAPTVGSISITSYPQPIV